MTGAADRSPFAVTGAALFERERARLHQGNADPPDPHTTATIFIVACIRTGPHDAFCAHSHVSGDDAEDEGDEDLQDHERGLHVPEVSEMPDAEGGGADEYRPRGGVRTHLAMAKQFQQRTEQEAAYAQLTARGRLTDVAELLRDHGFDTPPAEVA